MVTGIVKKIFLLPAALLIICTCSSQVQHSVSKKGSITIRFINTIKASPLVLDSMEYQNAFGEAYRVTKLKYYISNVSINTAQKKIAEPNSYHLIDAGDTTTLHFSFAAAVNNYTSISFMVGVDSIKNVSGAQSGALDPANGMFWTWNSGYVMFKLEGSSPVSNIINHRIEYHIGGFAGSTKVLQLITIPLSLHVGEKKNSEIIIAADIGKIWQGVNDLKIAVTPATMAPGVLSKKIADNYNRMFTIKEVVKG
jgi:hypothetical protein